MEEELEISLRRDLSLEADKGQVLLKGEDEKEGCDPTIGLEFLKDVHLKPEG